MKRPGGEEGVGKKTYREARAVGDKTRILSSSSSSTLQMSFLFPAEASRPEYVPLPPDDDDLLGVLQNKVGGFIEELAHKDGYKAEWTAYVNEEGLLKRLPANPVASRVLRALGFIVRDTIVGPVVLLGKDEGPLTEEQRRKVEAESVKIVGSLRS
jgi:hypothetical protein